MIEPVSITGKGSGIITLLSTGKQTISIVTKQPYTVIIQQIN